MAETTQTSGVTGQVTAGKELFPWWLVLIQGIVTLILGIFFLYRPYGTLFVLVTFLGAYWFVSGLIGLISLFWDRSNLGMKLLFGILGVIAGIAILAYPLYSAFMVPFIFIIMIGVWGLVMGFLGLFGAFKGGGWGAAIIGILLIIFGFLILANPYITTALLPFILGGVGVVGGIAAIIGSFFLRSRTPA
ncbi:MAG: DUF308 domain-containing protein [Methanomicrobiales archaeon]|nr:DUF308 domain-containing protein [Methanomicrobiales archaeon]